MATKNTRKTRTTGSNADATRSASRSATGTSRRGARKSKSPALITPEERHRMVAEAAYYRAERRGFEGGCTEQDWIEAEAEIDASLANRKTGKSV